MQKAIDLEGKQFQIDLMEEEAGELIIALARLRRGRESNVIEEIADVLIMASQMRTMFGPDAVDSVIAFKMERLRTTLANLAA